MAIKSVKTIRSLRRGLDVMRALDSGGALSLDQLHATTSIPKATLSRILVTLNQDGYASQRMADRKWMSGSGFGPTDQTDLAHNLLVQTASPELSALCEQVIWPSDLSVRSGLEMVLVETSRPQAKLLFNKLSVGFSIDFLMSAPGRAYLAFCPEKERRELLTSLKRRPEYGFLFESGQLTVILETVRKQGFGHRDSRWGGRGQEFTKDYDDGLDAIAVPIRVDETVLGCLNIVWIKSILSRKLIVERHLQQLRDTAFRISEAYRKT